MGGYGNYYERSGDSILSQTVKVEGSTYNGSIKLPVLKPDYYYLRVKREPSFFPGVLGGDYRNRPTVWK